MTRPFEDLVAEYHGLVMALISRYYGGRLRHQADDISQEVWAKLWENFKKNEQNITHFKSYLVRTVQTTLWDAMRALEKTRALDEIDEVGEPETEAPRISPHERMALADLMTRLSRPEAQMIRAWLQGFDYNEIAALTGSSEGRVRNLLTRTRKKLAKWGAS